MMTIQDLTQAIVASLDKHKAQDIRVLDVSEVTSLTDRFIIASGGSTTQVRALIDYVETDLLKYEVRALRTEGYSTALWTVLDYGSIVLHVFLDSSREFYDLERLWQYARVLDIAQFLEGEDQ